MAFDINELELPSH